MVALLLLELKIPCYVLDKRAKILVAETVVAPSVSLTAMADGNKLVLYPGESDAARNTTLECIPELPI